VQTPDAPGGSGSTWSVLVTAKPSSPACGFVAVQGPFDPVTGAIDGTTVQEQRDAAPPELEAISESGSSMRKVVT
jgi:hypothetical protein